MLNFIKKRMLTAVVVPVAATIKNKKLGIKLRLTYNFFYKSSVLLFFEGSQPENVVILFLFSHFYLLTVKNTCYVNKYL